MIRRLYNQDQEVLQQESGGFTDQKVISRICLVSVLLSPSVKRCFVSSMRDFWWTYWTEKGSTIWYYSPIALYQGFRDQEFKEEGALW